MTLKRTDTVLQVNAANGEGTPVVQDVLVANLSGQITVYALTDTAGDGLVHLEVNSSGKITQIDNQFEEGESIVTSHVFQDRGDPTGLELVTVADSTYVVTSAIFDTILQEEPSPGPTFFEVQGDGTLVSDSTFVREPGLQSIDVIQTGADTAFFFEVEKASGTSADTLVVANLTSLNFALPFRSTLNSAIAYEFHTTGLLTTDTFGDEDPDLPTFFYVNNTTNTVDFASFTTASSGVTGELAGTKTSFAKRPKDLEVLEVNGKTFLITSSELGGIRAFDVVGDTFFLPEVTLTDELDTNNGNTGFATDHIATFNVGNRGFVAAAGERLVIYELGRDGVFFAMDKKDWTHGEIHDIDVAVKGKTVTIVVAAENGLGTFQFSPDQAQNVTGTNKNDVILGDIRDNRFQGKAGNDTLTGAKGEDTLFGGGDRDELIGGNMDDRLYGGNGADFLKGGNGADLLEGGRGGDTLQDGRGSDTMIGGGGVDTFVMTRDTARDTIREWTTKDVIDVSVWGKGLDFEDLDIKRTTDGDLVVRYARDVLEIDANRALNVNSLNENDFIFA